MSDNTDLSATQKYYRKNSEKLRQYGREYYEKNKDKIKLKEKGKKYYRSLSNEEKQVQQGKVKKWLEEHGDYMKNYNKQYSENRFKNLETVIKLAKEYLNVEYTEEQLKAMPEAELKKIKKQIHSKRCNKFYHQNIEHYKEKITCNVCNKQYARCNKSSHIKTVFHRLHQDVQDVIKKV